jgi:hypothetical protein
MTIRLKHLLPKNVTEGVSDAPPPEVRWIDHSDGHAYAKAAGDGAGKQYFQGNVDFNNNESDIVSKAAEIIKKFENNKNLRSGGWNDKAKKWFPHRSLEGGTPTVAYGHKMLKGENFSNGLSDSQAEDLLHKDIREKVRVLKTNIKNFEALPLTVKIAAVNAAFRGDLGPRTMEHLEANDFRAAAKEYLNHNEYRTTSNKGVKRRMDWNAKVFASAG